MSYEWINAYKLQLDVSSSERFPLSIVQDINPDVVLLGKTNLKIIISVRNLSSIRIDSCERSLAVESSSPPRPFCLNQQDSSKQTISLCPAIVCLFVYIILVQVEGAGRRTGFCALLQVQILEKCLLMNF